MYSTPLESPFLTVTVFAGPGSVLRVRDTPSGDGRLWASQPHRSKVKGKTTVALVDLDLAVDEQLLDLQVPPGTRIEVAGDAHIYFDALAALSISAGSADIASRPVVLVQRALTVEFEDVYGYTRPRLRVFDLHAGNDPRLPEGRQVSLPSVKVSLKPGPFGSSAFDSEAFEFRAGPADVGLLIPPYPVEHPVVAEVVKHRTIWALGSRSTMGATFTDRTEARHRNPARGEELPFASLGESRDATPSRPISPPDGGSRRLEGPSGPPGPFQ